MTIEKLEVLPRSSRRRHWPRPVKEEIVGETLREGTSVAEVARRHDLDPSLLYRWRREMKVRRREGETRFLAADVLVSAEVGSEEPDAADEVAAPSGLIEIDLGDGRCVRVDRDVDARALQTVLFVLGHRR